MAEPWQRNLRAVTGLSTLLAFLAIAAFVLSFWTPCPEFSARWSEDFHVGLTGQEWDRRLAIYNDAQQGTYPSRIIDLVMDQGDGQPVVLEREEAWDALGLRYRLYQWPQLPAQWSLTISLWYPMIAFALWPLVRLTGACQRRMARNPLAATEIP